jgi:gamma-glutamylcyclotransferase (GGCT)/AIG2-like uncharacterized protein YtfP
MSNPDAQLPFFVYGTLRPHQGNYERFLEGRTASEVPGLLDGHALYAAGIPYVVESTPDAVVVGDLVFVLPCDYEDVLADLDRLEGCSPRRGGACHYQRHARPVRYLDADRVEATVVAWVYLAGPSARARLAGSRPVPGGDWVALSRPRLCGRP